MQLPALGLDYDSDPSGRRLSRPFATDPEAVAAVPEVDRMVFQARSFMKGRRVRSGPEPARRRPWTTSPGTGMPCSGRRTSRYRAPSTTPGLEHVNRVLQLDAYDAEANFLAGTLYRALQKIADARDAFGWAARSMAYRSAAYVPAGRDHGRERELGRGRPVRAAGHRLRSP